MNVNRNIKMLLLKLNKQGYDVSLVHEQKYSRNYDRVYSKYKLTFWKQIEKTNKKTGKSKIVSVPNTIEFANAIEMLKYMVVKSNEPKGNERKAESVC